MAGALTQGRAALARLAFPLAYAALLTHELDAVAREEWRVLPGLSQLPPEWAPTAFIALHLPLFAGLQAALGHPRPSLRQACQTVISAFLVVHLGLHLAFSGHVHYAFHTPLSQGLIVGGAVFGALHLWFGRESRLSARSGHG